ncbi:MAG: prepilin-type N-terminal cleavage/methylation domain-containing protein [Pirellulaceae bacterium]|jgi:prepilin-type N-terminal cleavage/methylation domain-containing protein
MKTGRRSRSAFTLVEMLVVITIIGILAALVLTGIYAVLPAVYKSIISTETATLSQAVERYKIEYGDYPPDFTDLNTVKRHLRKIFPRNAAAVVDSPEYLAWQDAVGKIDPAEALPFWLASVSSDPIFPLTSGLDPNYPFIKQSNRKVWFDFDQSRLSDVDGDGYPEYYPKFSNQAPFVYFDSRNYDHARASYPQQAFTDAQGNAYPATAFMGQIEFEGIARPYHERIPYDANGDSQLNYFFVDAKKFQIIGASLDGHYGTNPADVSSSLLDNVRVYPTGENYTINDADNITSFSDGQVLADGIPE